jgi:iron(III) transport system substrate-binding protein
MSLARGALLALLSVTLAGSLGLDAEAAETREVNVYSYRQPYLIDPLFKKFTDETGIKVNVIYAQKGLIERMAAEGRNSPADVLLTTDVGNLTQAKKPASASRPTRRNSRKKFPPRIATRTACGGVSPAVPA